MEKTVQRPEYIDGNTPQTDLLTQNNLASLKKLTSYSKNSRDSD